MKILYLDCETTGLSVYKDRIIQLSFIYDNEIEVKSKTILINPTIPISTGAQKVHHISDDMVKNEPTFSQVADRVFNILNDCDWIVTYNGNNFDLPMLAFELMRCGKTMPNKTSIDVYEMVKEFEGSKKLTDVYLRYTGRKLEGAHDASIDVSGTKEVFEILQNKKLEK